MRKRGATILNQEQALWVTVFAYIIYVLAGNSSQGG